MSLFRSTIASSLQGWVPNRSCQQECLYNERPCIDDTLKTMKRHRQAYLYIWCRESLAALLLHWRGWQLWTLQPWEWPCAEAWQLSALLPLPLRRLQQLPEPANQEFLRLFSVSSCRETFCQHTLSRIVHAFAVTKTPYSCKFC